MTCQADHNDAVETPHIRPSPEKSSVWRQAYCQPDTEESFQTVTFELAVQGAFTDPELIRHRPAVAVVACEQTLDIFPFRRLQARVAALREGRAGRGDRWRGVERLLLESDVLGSDQAVTATQ